MKQTYACTIYFQKDELERCPGICKSKASTDFRFALDKAFERWLDSGEDELRVQMDFVKVDNGSQTSGA